MSAGALRKFSRGRDFCLAGSIILEPDCVRLPAPSQTRGLLSCTDTMRYGKAFGGPPLAAFDMKSLARRGAEVRIAELNEEIKAIYGVFPDLNRRPKAKVSDTVSDAEPRRRGRKRMSAAQK